MSYHGTCDARLRTLPPDLADRALVDSVIRRELTRYVTGDQSLERALTRAALDLSAEVERLRGQLDTIPAWVR